jgi:predicted NodU family carbamoyl transferase
MRDGEILQYLQLERYTRQKHDNRLDLYLEELIDKDLIKLPEEFDIINVNSFVGNAFISKNGMLNVVEYGWDKMGYLSKFFNDNALNFKILNATSNEHCSVPGKLMGYAGYGNYDEKIEKWLKGNDYFKACWKNPEDALQSAKQMNLYGIIINNIFHKTVGPQ